MFKFVNIKNMYVNEGSVIIKKSNVMDGIDIANISIIKRALMEKAGIYLLNV